jgi:hypothetical protein
MCSLSHIDKAYFSGLLYRLLNEYCEIVLSLTEIVHLQQHDLTAFLFFRIVSEDCMTGVRKSRNRQNF